MTQRSCLWALILVLVVPFALAEDVAAASAAEGTDVAEAREVRTTWTSEFGVPHPAGVAYVPARDELLVAEASGTSTQILRLGPDENPQGELELPALSDTSTLAFDAAADQLTAVSDDELVVAPGSAITNKRPAVQHTNISDLGLDDATGATFDAATGTWFVLDEGTPAIVIVSERGTDPGAPAMVPLPHFAGRTLQGIAFNPSDGLLYVGSPDEDLVYGLDTSGNVAKTYSLRTLDLRNPTALTFAPSADSTDAPATQNLFIADAGDQQQLGGLVEVTLAAAAALDAPVDSGTLVQTIATSAFSPGSPDPSGVTYIPSADRLEICDSEVEEVTGAGYHGVNMWQTTRSGAVTDTGTTFPNISREPNGLGFIAASNTLLISDDSLRRVHLMRPGPDGRFGTGDDVVSFINAASYGSDDTEDPTFDPVSGHIFFVDGIDTEVFRIDPVNGVFGDGNDVMTHFDVGQFGITDTEALVYQPTTDTLIVGNRTGRELIEVTKTGALVRTIDLTGINDLDLVSGLTVAPASNNTGQLNYWIVDRGVDNGGNANENDGKLFEVAAGPTNNTAPVVGSARIDQSAPTTNAMLSVTATAHDDDGDPLILRYQWRKNGVAIVGQTGPTLDLAVAGNGDKGDAISVRVIAFDGIIESAPTTTAQVAIVNSPPTFGQDLDDQSNSEGDVVSLPATAVDADNDPLTYGATGLPPGLSINATTGVVSGTIANGAAGAYNVAVSVRDGAVPAVVDLFAWTVTANAVAPVVDSAQIDQSAPTTNAVLSVTVAAHDDDGDLLTYQHQWLKNGVAIQGETGATLDLAVAGNGDKGDLISVRVVAFDGLLESAPLTSAQVAIVNSSPAFDQNIGVQSNVERDVVSLPATATDADEDPLTYGATGLPPGLSINSTTGVVSGTIANGAAVGSPYNVVVAVGDGQVVDVIDTFTWTITALPAPPVVLPGSVSTLEGDAGTHTANVPVTLNHASSSPVTVEYVTFEPAGLANGAKAPGDYVAVSGTVTFDPGQTSAVVPVVINGDLVHEADESVLVSFRNPSGATIGGYFGIGFLFITNDDALPVVLPGSVSTLEGNVGTHAVNVPVTLNHASSSAVTVAYVTFEPAGLANGAKAPGDYVAVSGTVTFTPGQTAKTVRITIIGDRRVEPDESVLVSFRNPSGATIGGYFGIGFVVITNDD